MQIELILKKPITVVFKNPNRSERKIKIPIDLMTKRVEKSESLKRI